MGTGFSLFGKIKSRCRPRRQHQVVIKPFRWIDHEQFYPTRYLLFGHGTFRHSAKQAEHYFKLRPYLGRTDPALPRGIRLRSMLLAAILEQERREINQTIWRAFLGGTPTHTLHFGYRSLTTGQCYDILYLPITFRFQGHHGHSLAKRWGKFWVAQADKVSIMSLCPPSKRLLEAQIFWLTIAHVYLEYLLLEEPNQRL